MATELRSDIAAAKSAAGGTFLGANRELKRLPNYLQDDEPVVMVAAGTYANGAGVVALTDRRLLFVKDGITRTAVEDFPLDRINSIASTGGMVNGTIIVTVAGTRSEIVNVYKDDARRIADAVRETISRGSVPSFTPTVTETAAPAPAPTAAPAGEDVYEQLRKLAALRDDGILTPEEFDAKKAELVSRI
jgi:hypothetical protein